MVYYFLSEIVLLLHFFFVVFALAGGILVVWRRKTIWLHIPAAVWAALICFAGWVCPLTYLENWFRIRGGAAGYSEGFIVRYLYPVLYPAGLSHDDQVILGIIVIALNLAVYGYVFRVRSAGKSK